MALEPDQPGAHYGAASAAATLGNPEEALASLRAAIALNDRYAAAATSDDRFAEFRDREDFRALTADAVGAE